jgi:hypothetical protein
VVHEKLMEGGFLRGFRFRKLGGSVRIGRRRRERDTFEEVDGKGVEELVGDEEGEGIGWRGGARRERRSDRLLQR